MDLCHLSQLRRWQDRLLLERTPRSLFYQNREVTPMDLWHLKNEKTNHIPAGLSNISILPFSTVHGAGMASFPKMIGSLCASDATGHQRILLDKVQHQI